MEGQELAARHIALRERAGLTQEQEAKMAGVSPTTISGIESGKITRPHLKTLLKIAHALGVNVGELRDSGKVEASPSSIQPPLNGFEEERRADAYELALEAARRQVVQSRQATNRAEESGRAQTYFMRHENDSLMELSKYPPDELADALLRATRRYIADLENKPTNQTNRAAAEKVRTESA